MKSIRENKKIENYKEKYKYRYSYLLKPHSSNQSLKQTTYILCLAVT